MQHPLENLLTSEEAAGFLRVATRKLHSLRESGLEPPSIRIGRNVYHVESSPKGWLADNAVKGGSDE